MSAPILISIGSAVIFLLAFWWVETRNPSPMLDFKLFSSKLFSLSVTSAILNYMCVYSVIFLMPFYLIQGLGLSPSKAGLILTAMPIIMAIVAPISGGLSDRFGTRLLAFIGMVALATGLFLLSRLQSDSPPLDIAFRLAVTGLGIGVFISPKYQRVDGRRPTRTPGDRQRCSGNFAQHGYGLRRRICRRNIHHQTRPAGRSKREQFCAGNTSQLFSSNFHCDLRYH